MNNKLRLFIVGDASNLGTAMKKGTQSVNIFAKNTVSAFRKANDSIASFAERHIHGIVGMMGGVSFGMAAKTVIDYQSRLARLKIEGRLTAKQMLDLNDQIYQTAKLTHQDPGDLMSGLEKIIEKTGNVKFVQKHLKDLGIVASATGASLEDVAATASDLDEKMKIGDDLFRALDILKVQGKEGAFSLKALATQGNAVTSTAAGLGMTGLRGVRVMGGFLQLFMQATKSPDQTTTAFAAMGRDITTNYAKIQKLGINPFDVKESRRQGKNVFRDAYSLMKELITKTKGDATILRKIFNEESWSGVQALTRDGGLQKLDELINKPLGDGVETMQDFAFWSKQTAAALTDLKTQGKDFANTNLTGPIHLFTKALQFLNNNPVISKGLMYGLSGTAGLLFFNKIRGMFGGGKKGAPGGIAGGIPGFSGVQPVFVTNWPGGVGNIAGPYSIPGSGPINGGAGPKGSVIKSALGKVGLVATAGVVGWEVGRAIDKYLLPEKVQDAIGKGLNWALQPFSQAARDAIAASRENKLAGDMVIKIYNNERGQSIVETDSTVNKVFEGVRVKRSSFRNME